MQQPSFDLASPGTLAFTSQHALDGHALNKFALSLRLPANRSSFLEDEAAYMARFDMPEAHRSLLAARNWTGLLQAGGHLQAMLKVAATVGQGLWHIGAHNAGVDVEELKSAVPRHVEGLPPGARAAQRATSQATSSRQDT